nr:TctD-like protein [Chroomonas collegionis]
MYTVLLIDDEEKHLQATKQYLLYHGFNIKVATSGENAFEDIRNMKPDIIVLDIMMPLLDGYDFVEKLQKYKNYSQIPFIFVTAKGMTQDRIKGYRMGCSGYIPKPFDPDELVEIIKNVLKRKKSYIKEINILRKECKKMSSYLESKYKLLEGKDVSLDLTNRELNVLHFIMDGFRNKEIANTLKTSVRTIEKYVSRLLTKTNTKNRIELIKFVYSNKVYLRANDGDRTRE